MPQHPELPVRHVLDSRRVSPAPGGPPSRNPRRHGTRLTEQFQSARLARRLPVGIDPDLVFKIKAANTRLNDEALLPRGLMPLGETADYLYFVLASDEGTALSAALDQYTAGPNEDGAKGRLYTLFDRIDAIGEYGPEDRRGPGLTDLDATAQFHTVDVSIWPAEDWDEAERRARIVTRVVADSGGTIIHNATGTRRSVLRASVGEEGLNNLLATSVVERVRTPPVPFIDLSDWWAIEADDLALQPQDSVAVGVLDDAPATGHPLLSGLVTSVTEIGPAGYTWQVPGDHGTQVTSRVLLPNLAEELRDHSAITAVGTVHVARILEPVPGGPPDATQFGGGSGGLPPHEMIERAIRLLQGQYGVRVFNLSVGEREPFDAIHVSELTEVIDDLVRELDIVVVVPTGNARIYGQSRTASDHHAQRDYPAYLSTPEQRLTEPGTAALALTVGAIAHSDAPVATYRHRTRDTAIAGVDHVSPFSRTGPGIGTASARLNKPDLVAYGGNWVHDGDGDRVIPEDPGVGVLTAALDSSTGRLFRAACGTSFAVPAVARCAADVWAAYPGASANMVRALVTASAREPVGALSVNDQVTRHRLYGFGRPDTQRAIESGPQRVTMTFDGEMVTDTVVIHPIPIPEPFAQGVSATRILEVVLAFDPPVRRQRREYLAGAMQLDLYRAIDIEDLAEILCRQDPDAPNPLVNGRRHVQSLEPGVASLRSSTLQRRTWRPQRLNVDDGQSYLLAVTHRRHTWARGTDYDHQKYALAVTIADEGRTNLDLYALITQQIEVPARVRIRA